MSTKTRCMIPAAQQEEIRLANLGLKRNLGVCVLEERRRRSIKQTHLIKQCVNGPADWTRWGPADGFPHHRVGSAAPCPPQPSKKLFNRRHRHNHPPAPAFFPSCPRTLLACKYWLNTPYTSAVIGCTRPPASRCISVIFFIVVGLGGGRVDGEKWS